MTSSEHVTMTRDEAVGGRDDVTADWRYEPPPPLPSESVGADVTEPAASASAAASAEDFEICENNEVTSDYVVDRQQLVTIDRSSATSEVGREHHDLHQPQQKLPVCTELPATSPAVTATVARQQNTQPTSTAVIAGDHGRGKRRHKDDKSKPNDQSTEVHRSVIQLLYWHLNLFEIWCNLRPVAVPDHKIRQCIQRSALFPGRADGETRDLVRSIGAPRGSDGH